jgi:hypothetical protein
VIPLAPSVVGSHHGAKGVHLHRFALPLEDREQHDRGRDAGNREQDYQERAQGHSRIGILTEDVIRVAEHPVESVRQRLLRFVARTRSADPRWPTYAMAGATFPVTRPSPEDVAAQGAWLATQRERFQELQQQLLVEAATNPSRPR